MSQNEIEEILWRPYKLWPAKLSYRFRKLTGHKSVRNFPTYNSYVERQVGDSAKKLSAVIPAASKTKPLQSRLPEDSSKAPSSKAANKVSASAANSEPFRDLIKNGNGLLFLDTMDIWLARGVHVEPSDWVLYARTCVDEGEPRRLVDREWQVYGRATQSVRFRNYLFIALLMSGEFKRAADFALETLSGAATDKLNLIRIVGESYLLPDARISKGAIRQLLVHFRTELTPIELLYLYNVALDQVGEGYFLELVEPNSLKGVDPHTLLLLSNLALARGEHNRQVEYFNAATGRFSMSPVQLIDEAQALSASNVKPALPVGKNDGPLVSVMMSTFNSGGTVISALKSLRGQSYENLEIIVVDDCSSDDTTEKVSRYIDSDDSRVRLHRMDTNGGTYRARNFGLSNAVGEYFTCLDSDDWAHPDRISSLVAELQANSDLVAARSQLVRLSAFKGIKPRPAGYVQDDMSSLLFRRQKVIDQVGYYRQVKTGADSEFIERLQVVFGAASVALVRKPLLIADWTETSLSGSPITGITNGGTMSIARQKFRSEYRRKLKDGTGSYVPLANE